MAAAKVNWCFMVLYFLRKSPVLKKRGFFSKIGVILTFPIH